MTSLKNKIKEIEGGIFSAISWAIGGILLTWFSILNSNLDNQIGSLKFGILSAFVVDLFSLMWALILVPIIKKEYRISNLFPFKNKNIWILILSSFIGAPLGTAMYYMAILEISPTKASSISTLFPILSTMCVYLFFKQKTHWNTILGLIIAVTAASSLGIIESINQSNNWKGYLFISISVIAWGMEAFLSSISLKNDIDPYISILIRSLTSVITFILILLPSFGTYNNQIIINYFNNSKKTLFLLFLSGLFVCISFMLYYRAIDKLSVSKATGINITYAFWTMVIEPLTKILDSSWTPHKWYIYILGFLILFGAIFGLLDFKVKNKLEIGYKSKINIQIYLKNKNYSKKYRLKRCTTQNYKKLVKL
ncbi:EamA family transporter [Mycoplasmopsis lipophila]|uniref:EamA family transporter n=1 Tax=Mycoplasmopsis lipophila TaxID=2117 RepID=UPI0038738BD0